MADGWKLSVESTTAYLDSLRPAGSKRSGKRDLIVNVFLRQEGHLTADDLYDLIKREDQKISRATVYRTLQWMEEAGIARKIGRATGLKSSHLGISYSGFLV